MRGFMPWEEFVRRMGGGTIETPEQRHQRERGKPLYPPGYNSKTKAVAEKRMEKVDALRPELRSVVHDYGFTLVDQFLNCGVSDPKKIRHLIDFVRGYYLDGTPTWTGEKPANRKSTHTVARRRAEAM